MDAQAVLAQAPDGRVASSATRLAGSSGWSGSGRSAEALWGLCRGSGQAPYRVCVALPDRAAKCSCPSRKFPCKHGLALQLLDVRDPLPAGDAPDWVVEWLDRRRQAAQRASAPPDTSPEAEQRRARAKEKTARNRVEAVRGGVAGLADWLADVAGAGVAGLPARDAAWWHAIGARMVDAQAKGLASALEELRSAVAAGGPTWAHEAADRLGGLHLLVRLAGADGVLADADGAAGVPGGAGGAVGGVAGVPGAVGGSGGAGGGVDVAVVRRRLGFSVTEEEVRAGGSWSGCWLPLLKLETDDDLVRTVRQWVWGPEHGWVVAVRHAGGGARPLPPFAHGVGVRAVLHPYPGAGSRRVAVGDVVAEEPVAPPPAPPGWREALVGLAEDLAADPWLRLHPLGCAGVRVTADTAHLLDATGRGLPVRDDLALDQAIALTAGGPFDAWGLWNGRELRLGAIAEPGRAPEVVG
ncbi:SWIM zinc finger family protein [Actinosynnema sp. NPDC050436]|uniref:SWIM zinc finger family protein n=1 Tax=Actinosynnema sp. NPDC050436 TaxID=3155659 RepID=UPI0033F0B72C